MRSWAERSLDSRQLQLFLTAVISLNLLPFIGELPSWLMATSAALLAWNLLSIFQYVKRPSRMAHTVLAVVSMAGVFMHYRTLVGQEAATAFLVLLSGLKLLESVRYRDAMLIVFVSYFLLTDSVLFSQSLGMTIYLILDLMIITSLLFYLHGRDKLLSIKSFRFIMRTLAVAIPLWIFLFFLFPRFSAQLWRISAPNEANAGFSDDLNPGDISRLAQSDQIAFRATFLPGDRSVNQHGPRPEELYWRGVILWHSEGLKWSRSAKSAPSVYYTSSLNIADRTSPLLDQEIVLEPIFKKFLFALDTPWTVTFDDTHHFALARAGYIFEREANAAARIIYHARSGESPQLKNLTSADRTFYLQAPEPSEKDAALIATLRNGLVTGDASEVSGKVLAYLRDGHFRYTLQPGTLHGADGGLDEFLFTSKVGFCEHFAGSYATLMRWLGIPSRVVMGFQGGSFNDLGGYYTVRALDAHAWAEIWRDDLHRWERVDPTGIIAPLRLALGGEFNSADQTLLHSGLTRDQYQTSFLESSRLRRWYYRTQAVFDLLSSRWNNFLLRYDFEYQSDLLKKLGITHAERLVLALWVVLGIVVFLILLQLWLRRSRVQGDPVLDAYNRMCEAFGNKGLPRAANEGAVSYSERLIRAWQESRPEKQVSTADHGDLTQDIHSLMQDFIHLRYEAPADGIKRERERWCRRAKLFSVEIARRWPNNKL